MAGGYSVAIARGGKEKKDVVAGTDATFDAVTSLTIGWNNTWTDKAQLVAALDTARAKLLELAFPVT